MNRSEVIHSYENIRTYVTSKMDGYQFLADSDIGGNPYQVGNYAQYRLRGSAWEDTRLDAPADHLPHQRAVGLLD